MQITDSIADMLTRIRNANSAKHDTVKIPASNMKKAIAQILLDEGYIKGFKVEDDGMTVFDFNHPMAGCSLNFELELLSREPYNPGDAASQEEGAPHA